MAAPFGALTLRTPLLVHAEVEQKAIRFITVRCTTAMLIVSYCGLQCLLKLTLVLF